MFLNSVVLVLQEILEAALLISVMMVLTHLLRMSLKPSFQFRLSWIFYAVVAGVGGAWIYAYYMPMISEWFDYVGQEVFNAFLQIVIVLGLIIFSIIVPLLYRRRYIEHNSTIGLSTIIMLCMAAVVALAIIREGSEVILYLSGVGGYAENAAAVFGGSAIGAGIGISTGVLLYYMLLNMNKVWAFRVCQMLLSLVAGNMSAQAVLHLTQADWLPYTPIVWNSSTFLSESSITGQLLYALIGYEATPSVLQAGCYFLGIVIIMLGPLFKMVWLVKPSKT